MFHSLLNSLFGCSHRRTTFPLTPMRRGAGFTPAPGAARHSTYVVCLDCGKEFDYDWEGMRVGQPVTGRVAARPESSFAR
jgi:hypothetical protein